MSTFDSRPRTRHLAVLMLLGLTACAEAETAPDHAPLASVDADPGAIDGGVGAIDGAVDSIDAGGEEADAGSEEADAGAEVRDAGRVTVRDPDGAYFAEVRANGTGCPAGTWSTHLSPDGQSFRTTFSSFEVEVDRTRAISVKDCNLSIHIHAPEGLSFTVEDFYFGGYMYLEPGVQARMQTNYYFMGSPDLGAEIRTDFEGPKDMSYLVQDTRERVNVVQSRCESDVTLNARMTLRLRNSNPRRNGYVNVWEAPASADFGLKLSWKRCKQ